MRNITSSAGRLKKYQPEWRWIKCQVITSLCFSWYPSEISMVVITSTPPIPKPETKRQATTTNQDGAKSGEYRKKTITKRRINKGLFPAQCITEDTPDDAAGRPSKNKNGIDRGADIICSFALQFHVKGL